MWARNHRWPRRGHREVGPLAIQESFADPGREFTVLDLVAAETGNVARASIHQATPPSANFS